jgi:hypothetical protein
MKWRCGDSLKDGVGSMRKWTGDRCCVKANALNHYAGGEAVVSEALVWEEYSGGTG